MLDTFRRARTYKSVSLIVQLHTYGGILPLRTLNGRIKVSKLDNLANVVGIVPLMLCPTLSI